MIIAKCSGVSTPKQKGFPHCISFTGNGYNKFVIINFLEGKKKRPRARKKETIRLKRQKLLFSLTRPSPAARLFVSLH